MGLFKKPPILESPVVVKEITNISELEFLAGSFFDIEIPSGAEKLSDSMTKAVLLELPDGSTKMIDSKIIKSPEQPEVGDKGILTYREQTKRGFFGTISRHEIIGFEKKGASWR